MPVIGTMCYLRVRYLKREQHDFGFGDATVQPVTREGKADGACFIVEERLLIPAEEAASERQAVRAPAKAG